MVRHSLAVLQEENRAGYHLLVTTLSQAHLHCCLQ